jgi:hypothetical protein
VLKDRTDIDNRLAIAKPTNTYAPAYFDTYNNNVLLKDFLDNHPTNPTNPIEYSQQRSCLNPYFYHIITKFVGHAFAKYNSTTPSQVNIKYDHKQLIGVGSNIFYGSDIFTLAYKILSLAESKSFASSKDSLMLKLYKSLELPTVLREFSNRYKIIFTNPPIAGIILAGGSNYHNRNQKQYGKTRKYKSLTSNKCSKLTMIIKKYNEKTKKNLYHMKESCNCGSKSNLTKKIIDF